MLVIAACTVSVVVGSSGDPSLALLPPGTPAPMASSDRTPGETGRRPAFASAAGSLTSLPFDSPLDFVLDDTVDSGHVNPGTIIHVHLREPLALAGHVFAPAGTPASVRVITARKAIVPDVNGSVQISIAPLPLAGGQRLPLRPLHEFWSIDVSAGRASTGALSDLAQDIFVPGHVLYRTLLRRGHNVHLPPGTVVRARTLATISVGSSGRAVLSTPPPFTLGTDTPHSDVTPIPFVRYVPPPKPTPKHSPTAAPTASPNAEKGT
jgi:hypothetical protein